MTTRLQTIAEGEGLSLSPGVVAEIVRVSGGDMRKAITYLQSVARLRGEETVTEDDIREIAGVSEWGGAVVYNGSQSFVPYIIIYREVVFVEGLFCTHTVHWYLACIL